MQVAEFVSSLRSRYVDGVVSIYEEMFSRPLERFTDPDMLEMARFWKGASLDERNMLMKFMRLGSQASMASVLAVLDNTSSDFGSRFSLQAHGPDGTITELGEDLLDVFWEQEGVAGRVNRRAT